MANINVEDLPVLPSSELSASQYVIIYTSAGVGNGMLLADAVAQANVLNECECIKSASLTIASADVLQLNSTPLTIVSATGAGTAIEVISASVSIDFNTTAYATNTKLVIGSGGNKHYLELDCLNATVSTIRKLVDVAVTGTTDTSIVNNSGAGISVFGGDPTAGDSDITVYVLYRVITL